jgi:hypothetical protein
MTNPADALSQLTWFKRQFTPRPSPIPLPHPSTASPSPPPGSYPGPGPGPSTTHVSAKRKPAATKAAAKRTTQSASNTPAAPPVNISTADLDSGDNTASDPAVYQVKELVKHSDSHSLKGEGAGTRLCYIISWLNHTPADGDIVYDHAAVLRLHPSNLSSGARWGDGQTPFALSFSKGNIPQRLNRHNSYFHIAWREHVHAYANRHVERPSNRELRPRFNRQDLNLCLSTVSLPSMKSPHTRILALPQKVLRTTAPLPLLRRILLRRTWLFAHPFPSLPPLTVPQRVPLRHRWQWTFNYFSKSRLQTASSIV